MAATWSPDSWRSKPIVQVPDYEDEAALAEVLGKLEKFPPLVFYNEVARLREKLAGVAAGQGFVFQGGDCAESFKEHNANNIVDSFRVFLQSAVVMTFAGDLPVVKIGRIAGQFAKPRSSPIERVDGRELPSYRGDIINGAEFTEDARRPDPQRMLQAYRQSAATLNLLRALISGGYSSLDNVGLWMLDFEKRNASVEAYARYRELAGRIADSIRFMKTSGISTDSNSAEYRRVNFYTSHEALLLCYEQALTRRDNLMGSGNVLATSAHFLWVGDRTRQPDHAHVEYLRGIYNPIGIKIGPTLEPDGLLRLIDILDARNEPGKLTLIGRFGSDRIEKHLPKLVRAVAREGRKVIWMCDPMHGNTITASTGEKTRPLGRIKEEVERFFDIHHAEGTHAGGVHLEMTGQNVTECTGGAACIVDADLSKRYETLCDPRLNAEQSLELAFLVAERLKRLREGRGVAAAATSALA
ncbi:MAG: class II 3-deoxy-7-phosphoheptulonate synthase [Pseudomonadota bacterium]